MQLFDTARQTTVQVAPRHGEISLYVCGITPYEAAHLGHAFTYHVFDVLARRLRHDGVRVRSVRNVTDVDDDILRVARERGVDFRALGDQQVQRFDRDMADIGLEHVDAAPRATQHVAEMVSTVQRLQERDVAYAREGWVYFRTRAFPGYGSLSRLDVEEMLRLSRERGGDPDDPRKEHALDFVLWQPAREGEPRWPSPWGEGRPGWHIECTVLATESLGAPVDIHGGGDDLVFPHHESELAQAAGAGIDPFVRHWVHAAMVRLDGVKMSKSLGNLVFVRDLLGQVPGATVRLLLAGHHHRQAWDFTPEQLAAVDRLRSGLEAALLRGSEASDPRLEAQVLQCLDDDLDTPGVLRLLERAAAAPVPSAASMRVALGLLGVRLPAPAV